MKFSKIAVGSAAVIALALTGCAADTNNGGNEGTTEGQSYEWEMTITVGDASTWWKGAQKFGELLDEKSGGRMKLTVFPSEQLSGGDPAAGVEALMAGTKAFSYNSPIIYSGIDPRFGAITAPFLYENYAEADAAIAGGALDAYKALSEEQNIKLLGFGESGFRQMTNNKHEIKAPEDLKGLKFRVAGSALFLDIYKALGADPLTMNFAEVFTSLQNGTIDGQENPFDVIYSNGLMEVQKYLSIVNYVYDPLLLGMNLDIFNSLSEADQKIVQEAANEANDYQVKLSRDLEQTQLAEMKKVMTVTELDSAQIQAFRDALAGLYADYSGKWTPELFEAVQPK
ncbi:MAG: DctP family TRAP transporter solute-binding subunit [Microbacteriaceae bacterium]